MANRDVDLATKKNMYATTFKTAGGKLFLDWLNEQRDVLRDKAERENDPNTSYGFTKEAKGLNICLEHIKSMTKDWDV